MNGINGILLLDKPIGITSNKALQEVKHLLKAKKAGHSGSLDPLASGLLPICLGEATKFSRFLLNADKSYLVVAKLGERTDSADSYGKVIEQKPIPELTFEKIQQALLKFYGETEQLPPMYSAIKYKGQPLYKLARKGLKVERKARKINIYRINLIENKGEHVKFTVHCSKGTYIRSLVDEFGENLGCGAHVVELRRLSIGEYLVKDSIQLSRLKENIEHFFPEDLLLPIDSAIKNYSTVPLSEEQACCLVKGQKVAVSGLSRGNELVRLVIENSNEFIGIGEANGFGFIIPKRLINTEDINKNLCVIN